MKRFRGKLALVLYGLYLALAFGLPGWLQWRRTGAAGFRFGAFIASPAERAGGILFVLALALGLAAPVLELLGVLGTFEALRSPALGVLLTLVRHRRHAPRSARNGRLVARGVDPSERTALRTDGPFSWVRNPIFSWMILTAIGLALLVPNAASLVGLLTLVSAGHRSSCAWSRSPTCAHTRAPPRGYAARTGDFSRASGAESA